MAESTTETRIAEACKDVAHWRQQVGLATEAATRANERQDKAERGLVDARAALREATEALVQELA